jgi:hypothetical protein
MSQLLGAPQQIKVLAVPVLRLALLHGPRPREACVLYVPFWIPRPAT